MARKHLILIGCSLLLGCAQVGTITGGDRDEIAPQPILEKMVPQNASTNFTGNSVVIPFDEYFTLNNPAQTIRMVPPHTTIRTEVHKKTLTLTWDEDLEPNTTYAIYLNETVRDITERNDTTIQFVFSTGSEIDTLTYGVAVMDAYDSQPLDNVTVALYNPESGKLASFAKTENGIARLTYLPKGNYQLLAFSDANADLVLQENEQVGFPETNLVSIDSSRFDSIPLRLFKQNPVPKITTREVFAPCSYVIGANHDFQSPETRFYFGDHEVPPAQVEWLAPDSALVYPEINSAGSGSLIIHTPQLDDTSSYRFVARDFETELVVSAVNNAGVKPSEALEFKTNGFLSTLDPEMVHLINPLDSSEIKDFTVETKHYSFSVRMNNPALTSVRVQIDKGALATLCGENEAFEGTFKLLEERDLGSLVVDLSGYNSPVVLELLSGSKHVSFTPVATPNEPVTLAELAPGTYSFRVIQDANGNGTWDAGSLENRTQPEVVDPYSKPVKVRANWAVEVTLSPKE